MCVAVGLTFSITSEKLIRFSEWTIRVRKGRFTWKRIEFIRVKSGGITDDNIVETVDISQELKL